MSLNGAKPTYEQLETLARLGLSLADLVVTQELDEDLEPVHDDHDARERLHEASVLTHYSYAIFGKRHDRVDPAHQWAKSIRLGPRLKAALGEVPRNEKGAHVLIGLVGGWRDDEERTIERLERIAALAGRYVEALDYLQAALRTLPEGTWVEADRAYDAALDALRKGLAELAR